MTSNGAGQMTPNMIEESDMSDEAKRQHIINAVAKEHDTPPHPKDGKLLWAACPADADQHTQIYLFVPEAAWRIMFEGADSLSIDMRKVGMPLALVMGAPSSRKAGLVWMQALGAISNMEPEDKTNIKQDEPLFTCGERESYADGFREELMMSILIQPSAWGKLKDRKLSWKLWKTSKWPLEIFLVRTLNYASGLKEIKDILGDHPAVDLTMVEIGFEVPTVH